MEFKLVDEYIVKKDCYLYDRYNIRKLFSFKKYIIDKQMYAEKIDRETGWYDIFKDLKNKWKSEYSEITWFN